MRVFRIAATAVFIAAALAVVYLLFEPGPPHHIRIAAGPADGGYHAMASALAREIRPHGVRVEVLETHGSKDNIERMVRRGEAEFGIVQGGVQTSANTANLHTLATIDLEPVLIMARPGNAPQTFDDIARQRIIAGAPGSGTLDLFEQLVRLTGRSPRTAPLRLSNHEAAEAFAAGKGDVIFSVTPISSAWLRAFVHEQDVHFVSPPMQPALARHFRSLTELTLVKGVIDPKRDVPGRDVRILATATNLVARADVHAATKMLVLQALSHVDHGSRLLGTEGRFPSLDLAYYTVDPEAKRFFSKGLPWIRRNLPYWLANSVERLYLLILPLLTLLYPLVHGLPRLRNQRRHQVIERWYERLADIERAFAGAPTDESNIRRLSERLDRFARDLEARQKQLGSLQDYFALRFHVERVRRTLWRSMVTGWVEEMEKSVASGTAAPDAVTLRTRDELAADIDLELQALAAMEQRYRRSDVASEYVDDLLDLKRGFERLAMQLRRSSTDDGIDDDADALPPQTATSTVTRLYEHMPPTAGPRTSSSD